MRRLYDSYAGVLAGICARYITDADDQKDVLQESLIQIYTHISSFTYQGRGSLQAWMASACITASLASRTRLTASVGWWWVTHGCKQPKGEKTVATCCRETRRRALAICKSGHPKK